jgi:hypothetical protein
MWNGAMMHKNLVVKKNQSAPFLFLNEVMEYSTEMIVL